MSLKTVSCIHVKEDLCLRPIQADDAGRFKEIFDADPNIQTKYVSWTAGLKTVRQIEEKILGIDPGFQAYAIVEKDEVVGYVGASLPLDKRDGSEFRVGYFLDPAARGKGYVSASTRVLMSEIQKKFPVQVFVAYISDLNQASISIARKLGFEPTSRVVPDPALGGILERRHELRVA